MRTRTVTAIQTRFIGSTRREIIFIESTPTRIAGDSSFVSHPTHVRSGVAKETSVWLKRAYKVPRRGPIVIRIAIDLARLARAAVIPVATVSAVEEDLEDWTIVKWMNP
jgi:hypothetical protein